jgi:hypothetical protein
MTVPTYSPDAATTDTAPAGTDPVAEDAAAQPSCPACPHPLADHDPIGARYCRATAAAGATDRGCVCRH